MRMLYPLRWANLLIHSAIPERALSYTGQGAYCDIQERWRNLIWTLKSRTIKFQNSFIHYLSA